MINNIGKEGGTIRLVVALAIITLYFTDVLTPLIGFTFATVLFSIASVMLISGLFRSSPLKFILRRIHVRK